MIIAAVVAVVLVVGLSVGLVVGLGGGVPGQSAVVTTSPSSVATTTTTLTGQSRAGAQSDLSGVLGALRSSEGQPVSVISVRLSGIVARYHGRVLSFYPKGTSFLVTVVFQMSGSAVMTCLTLAPHKFTGRIC